MLTPILKASQLAQTKPVWARHTQPRCRRQVSSITAWQVSTLTGLALLVGLPLGIVAGRWSWALFARDLGIPAGAITPVSLVLFTVPAAILIANTVAFWPGRTTARLKPAEILRAE